LRRLHQWKKNGGEILGAEDGTHLFTGLEKEDAGNFAVETTDSNTSGADTIKSGPAELIVGMRASFAGWSMLAGLALCLTALGVRQSRKRSITD
jgi:hypothetical protein